MLTPSAPTAITVPLFDIPTHLPNLIKDVSSLAVKIVSSSHSNVVLLYL
jgi:hypothetical protein